MLNLCGKNHQKIWNNKKARPTLKILGAAISSHLISFFSLSGHLRTAAVKQKWSPESRKISWNRERKNFANISRDRVFRKKILVSLKKSLPGRLLQRLYIHRRFWWPVKIEAGSKYKCIEKMLNTIMCRSINIHHFTSTDTEKGELINFWFRSNDFNNRYVFWIFLHKFPRRFIVRFKRKSGLQDNTVNLYCIRFSKCLVERQSGSPVSYNISHFWNIIGHLPYST